MNSEKIEKTLQEWKLPPSSASDVFKRKSIFSFSPDPTLHTVEKEIPLSEGYASFPLIDNLKRVYKNQYSFIHVGMIQVGLKPTKLGSKTSAIICLRDGRTLKFGISVLGMVESSLSDGPIYFSFFPTYCVSLADRHSAFTIDIKTQGCSGKGNVVLMYRFHYKVTDGAISETKNLARALVDSRGETTLFLTNVGRSRSRSNRVVSNKIYWDQVSVPEKWLDENNPSSSAATQKEGEVARMDWKEAAEAYALKVDVPGFKKDEVRVEVEAGRELVISGERRLNEQEEDGKWWCIERSSGKFLRRLRLPEDAKMDEVMAGMENGVLTVTVPKDEVKVKEKPEVKVIHISG